MVASQTQFRPENGHLPKEHCKEHLRIIFSSFIYSMHIYLYIVFHYLCSLCALDCKSKFECHVIKIQIIIQIQITALFDFLDVVGQHVWKYIVQTRYNLYSITELCQWHFLKDKLMPKPLHSQGSSEIYLAWVWMYCMCVNVWVCVCTYLRLCIMYLGVR